jgi:hypothetical protein
MSKNAMSKNAMSKNAMSKNAMSKNAMSKNAMSKNAVSKNAMSPSNPAPRPNTPAGRRPAPPAPPSRRRWLIALPVLAVVALVVALVAATALSGPGTPGTGGTGAVPLGGATARAVTHVPPAALRAVGDPSGLAAPRAVAGRPPELTGPGGRPEVLYIGAEYCPFCAAQRWALAVALSRFGTLSGLEATHSSRVDPTDPGTPTLSFAHARYVSPWVDFVPVELASNRVVNGNYAPLEHPSAAQQSLLDRYDRAPYTTETGAIPFLDFGNRRILVGASYDPALLHGLTQAQVARDLSHPSSPVAQAVDGTANRLTAAVCQLTGGRPGRVCRTPGVVGG